jgi:hypothetical protein
MTRAESKILYRDCSTEGVKRLRRHNRSPPIDSALCLKTFVDVVLFFERK